MRIAIDLTELYDNFSGIERYAFCVSRQLIENYQQNEYIIIFKNEIFKGMEKYCHFANVKTVVLKGKDKLKFSQITLCKAINKLQFDFCLFLCYPMPYFLRRKNKCISAIHDMCIYDCPETMTFKSRAFFRVLCNKAIKTNRGIITVSDFSVSRIKFYYKYTPPIIVTYSGVDHIFENYKQTELSPCEILKKYGIEGNYILSLSTLEPRKNLSFLIEAFKKIYNEDKNYKLVLAGRKGWKIDNLLKGIDNNILENIICTGFIDEADLPALYSNAKCFVFASKYEGFGLPPVEAMAMGSLVVSSDAASMPEVLGDAALYFKSNDLNSLIFTLKNALAFSEDEKNEFLKRGEKRAKLYTWPDCAKHIMDGLYGLSD